MKEEKKFCFFLNESRLKGYSNNCFWVIPCQKLGGKDQHQKEAFLMLSKDERTIGIIIASRTSILGFNSTNIRCPLAKPNLKEIPLY